MLISASGTLQSQQGAAISREVAVLCLKELKYVYILQELPKCKISQCSLYNIKMYLKFPFIGLTLKVHLLHIVLYKCTVRAYLWPFAIRKALNAR
jgi:hypothetical protein